MNNLIVLFGLPRTGSNNVCSLLNNSNNIIYNSEDFNGRLGIKCMNSDIKKYLIEKTNMEEDNLHKYIKCNPYNYIKLLTNFRTNEFKLLKIFYSHLSMTKIINILKSDCKKIILKRNFLEIYLSNEIAEKINKWYNFDTSNIKIKIDFNDFIKHYKIWHIYYKKLEEYKDQNTVLINYNDFSKLNQLEQYNFFKNKLAKINIELDEKMTINNHFNKQSKMPIEKQIINYSEIKYWSDKYNLEI
tara:strand:- start:607 stop:1338 length:732 start_codon:yes stop_codon:yes gene_type:complete